MSIKALGMSAINRIIDLADPIMRFDGVIYDSKNVTIARTCVSGSAGLDIVIKGNKTILGGTAYAGHYVLTKFGNLSVDVPSASFFRAATAQDIMDLIKALNAEPSVKVIKAILHTLNDLLPAVK